ncbi:MAG: amino acid oxidase [Planctomycetes bacterium SCN 63-9]|nr:MAG: amino acid oxidase [Planctomycetes bacterium SCN 63-9]
MRFQTYDAVVIGGGFYGSVVGRELRRYFDRVLILEQEKDLMQRASYVNQARVHQGYHYPRSILTSLRSRLNFTRFVDEYGGAVVSEFEKYYAIARTFSKVNARQFKQFCDRIGAPVGPAPSRVKALLNPFHIEETFTVLEYAFNSAKLKDLIKAQLVANDVEFQLRSSLETARPAGRSLRLTVEHEGATDTIEARYVFNCSYSHINGVLWRSGLPLIPMKHEFAEMALIDVKEPLKGMGITIMDGPFFATMPFPDRNLHSLHHVRYTPHHSWLDTRDGGYLDARKHFASHRPASHYEHMIKDGIRYIPSLADARYVESLWEIKTVLPRSEVDDSRPILFRPVDDVPNIICILGGKIDNVFDIQSYIGEFLGAEGAAR